jgi:hypothetical protein
MPGQRRLGSASQVTRETMKTHQLLRVVTAKGKRYYVDSRRVSRDAYLALKSGPGKSQDTFITRSDKHATRDWSTLRIA